MIKLDNFFSIRYKDWEEVEVAINALPTAQERGEIFEQFVYIYLLLNKDYYQINEIYRSKQLPENWREHLSLENVDYGVDGVWLLMDGTYAAYQAKFRESRASATVRELATFWSEAEKADHKYIIANAVDLPKPANKHGYSILVDTFEALGEKFFEDIFTLYQGQVPTKKEQYKPLLHQQRMITKTLEGFEKNDRGKLIAACGAGKTLVALWIAEASGAKRVIFLAPSLALIKQTLEAWSKHANNRFTYLCVCSDQTVVNEIDADYGDYSVSEIDFPVTTNPEKVRAFLSMEGEYKYIFATYHSASVIADALKGYEFSFQLGIFDEAHRTAGQKETKMFSIALRDEGISIDKRLFMTATERLVTPRIKTKAREANRVVFSMDDKETYGPLFDRYSFGEAIKDEVISDYRIVLTAIDKEEVVAMIQENALLVAGKETTTGLVTAENIFKQIVLAKAMREFDLKKAISFHSSVRRARAFISGKDNETFDLGDLMKTLWPELEGCRRYFASVDGLMPAGLRKQKLKEFEDADFAVISNAKCLTEGVDVPIIDSIYFVDPKTSLVDIVQACGRALRKGGKRAMAHFIVPVLLYPLDADPKKIENERFETLLNLVQALRDQDERLADIIDRINMQVIRGGSLSKEGNELPLSIRIPKQFNFDAFSREVQLRILEANGKATKPQHIEELKVRKSYSKGLLKPVADYAYDTMFDKLVTPTLEKFGVDQTIKDIHSLALNHNSISHTERLHLIEKNVAGYRLTDIGKKFKNQEIDRKEVMRLMMLNYNCGEKGKMIYSYRALLEILLSVNKMNYIEFLFGAYTLQDTTSSSIDDAVAIINEIRTEYPNILLATPANKKQMTEALNSRYRTSFSFAEMWGSTTPKNKFLYFGGHLSVFEGINKQNAEIVIQEDAKPEIIDILESSRPLADG